MTSAMREVPFFNYPHVFQQHEEEYVDVFRDVGRRGAFIMQRDLEDFERAAADFVSARYALGVANATDAMTIALRAAGLRPGDEVIFSSHTFVATAGAIYLAGGVPVPIECASDHLMDPDAIEEAISSRTRFILPTQLNGRTCKMDQISAVAGRYNLQVIEDAAQAFGAKYRDRAAGTFGIAAAVSFYPAKTLGCFGDGGLILTNDEETYNELRLHRDHGRHETGDVVIWGTNTRLDNLQAAILNRKLAHYPSEIHRRRDIAALYDQGLRDVSQLSLPPAPDSDPLYFDIYQNYEIEAERRDELQRYLTKCGVGTLVQWGGKAVHQFRKLGFCQTLPRTTAMMARILMLPMNTSLSDEDVRYVCNQIRVFYGE